MSQLVNKPSSQPEVEEEIGYYYDLHPTKEDLMGDSTAQSNLRLYDKNGERRLTGEEAERVQKEKAWAKLREMGIDPQQL